MSSRRDPDRGSRGGSLAAWALGGAVVLPIVLLFLYAVTGLRFPWLILIAVVGAMTLVVIGVRRSAGGNS